jgi:hypothetical protein
MKMTDPHDDCKDVSAWARTEDRIEPDDAYRAANALGWLLVFVIVMICSAFFWTIYKVAM